jgi:hypothetical protein
MLYSPSLLYTECVLNKLFTKMEIKAATTTTTATKTTTSKSTKE